MRYADSVGNTVFGWPRKNLKTDLRTTKGEYWKCSLLTVTHLEVRDGEIGTRVYATSGLYRLVIQSPEQIRTQFRSSIPDDYPNPDGLISRHLKLRGVRDATDG